MLHLDGDDIRSGFGDTADGRDVDTAVDLKRSVFIGCGPRAREHAAAYRLVQLGRPVAACARTPAQVNAFCRDHAIPHGYLDIEEMLESERPDLLHIVTDPGQRVALMTLAAEHEVPVVIVEKPIAIDSGDWAALCRLAATTTTRFVVNTQLRFHPRHLDLWRSVHEGRIGDVRFIDTSAGSTILDQGVHLLDLAHWYAGRAAPTRVFAQMAGGAERTSQPCPDMSLALLEFENGVRAQMVTGATAPLVEALEPFYLQKRIAVIGDRGHVQWTMFGWERFTEDTGYESGRHDYPEEEERGQAALTDTAFALLEPNAPPHPCRIERSLLQFNVVLGCYLSALRRESVNLPCEPPDGLLGSLRRALPGHIR